MYSHQLLNDNLSRAHNYLYVYSPLHSFFFLTIEQTRITTVIMAAKGKNSKTIKLMKARLQNRLGDDTFGLTIRLGIEGPPTLSDENIDSI